MQKQSDISPSWVNELSTEVIEKELLGAEIDSSDLSPRLSQWLVRQADITGQWDSSYWHDGVVHLTIRKRADGRFDIVYYARGDITSWVLKRIANFENGVLEFNKSVWEYGPYDPYKYFYLLRVNNSLYFASHPVAKEWIVAEEPKGWILLGMPKKIKTEPTDTPNTR
ncbi:hypothetical protein [Desulfonema magnum]|uniref:Uncharacterized protein n=1 Tax=Desulfonema magnum TaxID=45655 RepID=A0A975BY21_9BACT|nr:hypothetical protein [Desulfonema magnum]QTA93725.1 Uncharacterized protein dnm_098290 [Desulfonema magnum]